jgi:hypothetical protein
VSGDRICDTNPEANPVFGCPGSSISCGSSDPFHNYMDYSDDDCYEEFTPEQINRMRCTLANWRVDLPDSCPLATVQTRNAGLNLNVMTGTPAVLGQSFSLDINAPGRTSAVIFAYRAPGFRTFANGMVGLVDAASPQFFQRTIALPGSLVLSMPSNLALCGATAYTQAALLGGGSWALTNAVDLTAGL